jgi:hypothetical protein
MVRLSLGESFSQFPNAIRSQLFSSAVHFRHFASQPVSIKHRQLLVQLLGCVWLHVI